MRRSRSGRNLLIGFLAMLASAFCAFAALADGSSFWEAGVAQRAFEAIANSVGKNFDVMGVRITPTELMVDLIPSDSATDAQTWRVSHKGLIAGVLGWDHASRVTSGTAVSRIGPIKDSRFPLSAEALAAVPKLVQMALAKARLDSAAHVSELELRRLPAIVGEASKTPIWQLQVAAVDEEADFGANLKGEITSSDLRRTNRAARLNLFAGGEDFDDFVVRIRKETGKSWIFHRIEIEKQDIALDMRIASSPDAPVQRFNASISEIKTTSLDTPHFVLPGASADAPFDLAEINFGLLLSVEQAAIDKLAIAKGAVNRVTISRPQLENGAAIEWTVDVKQSDLPIFRMPGQPEPLEGSVTFDGKGALLRAVYPKGDSREPNFLDIASLKIALADVATQLGPHEPVVEIDVSKSTILLRAADPKAPAKLVFYEYQNGLVGRSMLNGSGAAEALGDGPDFRWDLSMLTSEVIDRLTALTARAVATHPKPNAKLTDLKFTKDKLFNPSNMEPLIEITTEADGDSQSATYDFSGGAPRALAAAPPKSGLFINGKNVADGASDNDSDLNACEYSENSQVVIAACSRWLDANPNDEPHGRAIEYYNRGNGYLKLEQWSSAIADYSKALQVDPKYQRPYTNRAYAYQSNGDAPHALADANKAIEIDAKKTFAYIVRGFANQTLGQWDAALADFTVAINQTNGQAQLYFDRGLAYYSGKGDLANAIGDFTQAIAYDPKHAEAFVYRGMSRRLQGDLGAAIADHTDALQADPRNASAYFNRGMEYYLTGALPKALADLAQANALAPKEAYLALLLDVVTTRSGLPSPLKDLSSKVDMGAWPAPALRLLLSQSTPEALTAAADDGAPADRARRLCEAAFYTGVAFARAGKSDNAVAKWQEAIATCPRPTPERSYAEVELKAAGAAKP